MKQLERPQSLTVLAVDTLRRSIVSGDFGLGEQLSEAALARMLGISKTPVREALQQLRSEGLVRIIPQTGSFVFTMSAHEVSDLCELRLTLEEAALHFAIKRNRTPFLNALKKIVIEMDEAQKQDDKRAYLALDTDYHGQFFEFCGNAYMADAYARIEGQVAAIRTHLAARPSHTEKSMTEHRSIVRAIEAGEDNTLRSLLHRHIGRTRKSYADNIDDIAQADRAFDANRPRSKQLRPVG
jgi:DNA-binding GntR family transcriptional regulator